MRRTWLIMALASVTACSGGGSPTGQVVATVDGEEITRAELGSELPDKTAVTSSAASAVRDAALEQLVAQRVIAEEARREGLDKSQPFLLAKRQAEEKILAEMIGRRVQQGLRDPDDDAINQFIAANPSRFAQRTLFQADQLRVPLGSIDPVTLKDVNTFSGVRERFQAAGLEPVRSSLTIDSTGLEPQDVRRLMALPPGEPFLTNGSGMLIATVITASEPAPLIGDKAHDAALLIMKQQAIASTLKRQYLALRRAAKVEYQKGFAPPPASAKQ